MSDTDDDHRLTGRRRPRSEITPQSARRRRTRRRQPPSLEIPEPPLAPEPVRSDSNLFFERMHEMGFDSDWEEIYPSLRQQQPATTPTGVGDIFNTPSDQVDELVIQEIEHDTNSTGSTAIVTPATTVGSRTPPPPVTDDRFNRWITPTITTTSTNECPICTAGFVRGDDIIQMTNCIHVYHRGCIRRWCIDHNHNTCPMCRAEYHFGRVKRRQRVKRRKRKRKYY